MSNSYKCDSNDVNKPGIKGIKHTAVYRPLIATLGAVMFSAISGALADQICAEIG
jgi:hypothetical protein